MKTAVRKKLEITSNPFQKRESKETQFHAVISTKFQQHNKEELAKVAEDFMQEMGYEEINHLL